MQNDRETEPVGTRPGRHDRSWSLDEAGAKAALQTRLHWQSQLVLLLVLPTAAVWAVVLFPRAPSPPAGLLMLGVGVALAALVGLARAATPAGAATGGLLMACFCLTTPGWRSCGWAVAAMLALTLAATRFGRARKQRLGIAESRGGRGAAQVAANLGVAALAGTLANAHGTQLALAALLASLAEAAADTLASELGQVLGGNPRLITTLRAVPTGTDGGITLAGTGLGVAGAAIVAATGGLALRLPVWIVGLAAGAGLAGLLLDSLLGATLERACWLNNDAVNFLSTLAAALVALGAGGVFMRR